MVTRRRRYPVGIQTFSEIIEKGYVYVDKTDLVWQLADYAKYIFLTRPRRFGKSLLSSTLHSYFAGERDLFEGLKIMELEQEWKHYPVLHFDLSDAKHMPAEEVRKDLGRIIKPYENIYGNDPDETSPGMRMAGLVNRAYEQTGEQVVVIIDEYDAPLLDDGRVVTEFGKAKCAGGRTDIMVWMPDTIYVFELKAGGTAEEALKQIDDKGYAIPYASDGRKIVKVSVAFNTITQTIESWQSDIQKS